MKWTKKDINGLLISKDLVGPLEYTLYNLLKRKSPDKRWISSSALGELAWIWMSEPSSVLAECDSELKGTQLKAAGQKISTQLSDGMWSLYKMPEKDIYAGYWGVEFVRLYKARRNKTIKILTKREDCLLIGTFGNEQDYDIFKIIQWLSEWDKESSLYEVHRDNFLKYAKALIDYEEKDKLFNMHFGDEYSEKDKNDFTINLTKIYEYIKKEIPVKIMVSMTRSNIHNITLEADI